MATVIGNNQVKLDNGQTISAQQGGWYDGQQFWGGSLSAPGVINSQSNQIGAGQAVSSEVNRASSVAQGKAPEAIDNYLANRRASAPSGNVVPAGIVSPQPTGPGIPGGVTMPATTQASINLPQLYDQMYKSQGISDLEAKIAEQTEGFNKAASTINDNPFLAEANRVGRIQKLQTDFNNATAGIREDVARKKADVTTRLDLETKQYDINSQQAQQARDQFDRLLASGALSGASAEDIANLTRSTGLSSGIIQAAINNNKQSGLKTDTTSFDDGTNEGIIIYSVDSQGNVINQQRLITGKSSNKASTGYSQSPFVNSYIGETSQSGAKPKSPDVSTISSGWSIGN